MATLKAKKFEGAKRTHLNLAVPQPLKRKLEEAADARGWSLSNEATFRLETSFEKQDLLPQVLGLAHPSLAPMIAEFHKLGRVNLPPDRMDSLLLFVRAQIEAELKVGAGKRAAQKEQAEKALAEMQKAKGKPKK